MPTVRNYTSSDKEKLRELVIVSNIFQKQSLEKETVDVERTREVTAKNFDEALKQEGYHYIVAEVDKKLVGFIFVEVSPVYVGRGSIVDLFILEELRSQGIGKVLMEKGLEWLKTQGVNKISVAAHKSNTTALHLYESFGFEKAEETYVVLEKLI